VPKKEKKENKRSTLKTFCLAYTSVFQNQGKSFDYAAPTETVKVHMLTLIMKDHLDHSLNFPVYNDLFFQIPKDNVWPFLLLTKPVETSSSKYTSAFLKTTENKWGVLKLTQLGAARQR